MPAAETDLKGLRLLVIEDNFLVAETIRDSLEQAGGQVVGPAPSVQRGLALIHDNALDGAVLDINLNGDVCFPIALALRDRDVPFVFLTGYDDVAIVPPELQTTPRLSKPFDYDQLPGLVAAGLNLADALRAKADAPEHRREAEDDQPDIVQPHHR